MHCRLLTDKDGRIFANGNSTTYGSVAEFVNNCRSLLTNPVNRSNVDNDHISCDVRIGEKLGEGSAGIVWKVQVVLFCLVFNKI